MSNFFKQRELTEEEQELQYALDDHRDALKDEKNVMATAGLLYIVGFPLLIFGNDRIERVGLALALCAVFSIFLGMLLQLRTRKYRIKAGELLDAYTRKNALPFYQELVEMFADKPGIHLHLNDNGTIVVTDKRKKEEK